jgi:hypothetical protein
MGSSNHTRNSGGSVVGTEEDTEEPEDELECSNCGHAVDDSAHGCDHCDFDYLCDDCLVDHDCSGDYNEESD